MVVNVAILGLNAVSVSTALALNAKGADIRCRGWDADPDNRVAADDSGAFHPVCKKIKSALVDATLVILALPPEELKTVLVEYKEKLNSSVVLINMSRLHALPAQLVEESLGNSANFVSLLPLLNPAYVQDSMSEVQTGRADMFADSLAYVTAPPTADARGMNIAVDLAVLLGCLPVFADACEVDGLIAANLLIPELAASVLMTAVSAQPSWREGKTIAGNALAQTTVPLAQLPAAETAQIVYANRENTIRLLDDLAANLQRAKQALQAQDSRALEDLFGIAVQNRSEWLKSREQPEGIKAATSSIPTEKYALERFMKLGN